MKKNLCLFLLLFVSIILSGQIKKTVQKPQIQTKNKLQPKASNAPKNTLTKDNNVSVFWDGDKTVKILFDKTEYLFEPYETKSLNLPYNSYVLSVKMASGVSYPSDNFLVIKPTENQITIYMEGKTLYFKKNAKTDQVTQKEQKTEQTSSETGSNLTYKNTINQDKIATIFLDSLVNNMKEYKDAEQSLRIYTKQLEDNKSTMQAELEARYKIYMENEKNMSKLILETKQKELQDLQLKIEEFSTQSETEIREKSSELYHPVYVKVKKAIEGFALEQSFKLVLDVTKGKSQFLTLGERLLYSENNDSFLTQSVDITNLIAKRMGVSLTK